MSEPVAPTLFVGIGSPHGNDCLGWLAADELRRRYPANHPDLEVRCAQIPADLLDWLEGRRRLLLCDACCMHGEPGAIYRWNWPEAAFFDLESWSSHGGNLGSVLQLAERLQYLPESVVIWGIEVGTQPGLSMMSVDDQLAETVPVLISQVLAELQHA